MPSVFVQQWVRIPYVYKGAFAGGAAATPAVIRVLSADVDTLRAPVVADPGN